MQQTQLGTASMILGIIGLLLTMMGCSFPPLLMIGVILSGVALGLGFVAKQKVAAGEVPEKEGQMALVGQVTGGLGCGLQLLFGLGLGAIVLLYMGLIVVGVFLQM